MGGSLAAVSVSAAGPCALGSSASVWGRLLSFAIVLVVYGGSFALFQQDSWRYILGNGARKWSVPVSPAPFSSLASSGSYYSSPPPGHIKAEGKPIRLMQV